MNLKKLSLRKDTLLSLSEAEAANIAGGMRPPTRNTTCPECGEVTEETCYTCRTCDTCRVTECRATCNTDCGTCPGNTCNTQCDQASCGATYCGTCDTCMTACNQIACQPTRKLYDTCFTCAENGCQTNQYNYCIEQPY